MKKLKESIKENWKFFLLFFGWLVVSAAVFVLTVYLFANYPAGIFWVILFQSALSGVTVLLILVILWDYIICRRLKK